MHAKFIFLFLAAAMSTCHSQQLIERATVQRWTGGVAGRSGVSYHILFSGKEKGELVAVYLQGNPCPFKEGHGLSVYEHDGKYQASFGISSYEDLGRGQEQPEHESGDPRGVDCLDPPAFQGAALLIFQKGNQELAVQLDAFEPLPSQAYP